MLATEFRVAVSAVIASPVLRRLLPAFAVSAVGDGMSAVGVAWLAIRIAPPADRGLVVGVAVAAYTLPGAAGAVLLARPLRALAGRQLVAADAALRAVIPDLLALAPLRATPRQDPAGWHLVLKPGTRPTGG
jgi:DHA3 family macrolide efflux protein-like MFS transporter